MLIFLTDLPHLLVKSDNMYTVHIVQTYMCMYAHACQKSEWLEQVAYDYE